jgi:REP element-mobilizing transposase RayT
MSNHLRMIASASGEDSLSDILRDFKKFTSKAIIKAVPGSTRESAGLDAEPVLVRGEEQ